MYCICAIFAVLYLGIDIMTIITLGVGLAIAVIMFIVSYRPAKVGIFLAYCIAACCFHEFVFFIPLIAYDLLLTKHQVFAFTAGLPIYFAFDDIKGQATIVLCTIVLLGFVLRNLDINNKHLTKAVNKNDLEMARLRSDLERLSTEEDANLEVATLNERTRISRDIHDNVGHKLSSALLQLGAVITTAKDETQKAQLMTIRDTLNDAMTSIRTSVHNLQEEAIDLRGQLEKLCKEFEFCPALLTYTVETPPLPKIRFAVISITSEALQNCLKHSNATEITVKFEESESIYQLEIKDNGTIFTTKPTGIGLENIRQRTEALGGSVVFDSRGGFKIFASFPKGDEQDGKNQNLSL